jgi:hypothetical protein
VKDEIFEKGITTAFIHVSNDKQPEPKTWV